MIDQATSLVSLDGPSGSHGREIVLPHAAGYAVKTDAFSTWVGEVGEVGAFPVTLQTTHPLAMRGPASDQGGVFELSLDNVAVNAWVGVTWRRGNASFYVEADLGSTFVVHATWVGVQVITFWNARQVPDVRPDRVTSISLTRGIHGGGQATWTGVPIVYSAPLVAAGVNLRIPPLARAFRVFSSTRAAYAVLIAECTIVGDAPYVVASFLAVPGEEYALAARGGTLRLYPQLGGVPDYAERVTVQFLLDL